MPASPPVGRPTRQPSGREGGRRPEPATQTPGHDNGVA
eukprot:CAMPEP_0118810876 /NCGR_PEP_ID=MMETSP1162-20130426/1274_1 /TAXON_ID=33656 /ORGANISM="Phaeocystis Sp, Strain CCMP2710" /LENGTH=37 /DNA_ID= /DNA_START= /DNA_END= /DNA_ORIENTATION=